jgi:hypothetical protein
MIRHSFTEAFRLISRSRRESALFLAAAALSSVLYILACLALGISYDYQTTLDSIKANPLKGAIAMVPGGLVMAWFGAGISGRLAMDAFMAAPETLTAYAKGWFLRYLAGSLLLNGGFLAVLLVFNAVPRPEGMGLMAAWSLFCLWVLVRVCLWEAAMFIDGLSPVAAMRRSYSVSSGSALKLGVIVFLPFLILSVLMKLAGLLPWTGPLSLTVARDVFEGAILVVAAGAFAAAYLKLRVPAAPAAAVITGEEK